MTTEKVLIGQVTNWACIPSLVSAVQSESVVNVVGGAQEAVHDPGLHLAARVHATSMTRIKTPKPAMPFGEKFTSMLCDLFREESGDQEIDMGRQVGRVECGRGHLLIEDARAMPSTRASMESNSHEAPARPSTMSGKRKGRGASVSAAVACGFRRGCRKGGGGGGGGGGCEGKGEPQKASKGRSLAGMDAILTFSSEISTAVLPRKSYARSGQNLWLAS